MNKNITTLIVLFALLFANHLKAQNNDVRKLSSFTQIHSSGSMDVKYVVDNDYRVEINTTDNINVNAVTSRVDNSMLYVNVENKNGTSENIKVVVYAPVITSVSLQGSSDFEAQRVVAGVFSIALSGSSDAKIGELNIDNNINIALSASSDLNVNKLNAKIINVAAKGSCDFKANMLNSTQLNIALDGSSDVDLKTVKVDSVVNISAKSSSDIKIGGEANKVNIAAGGMSDINVSKLKYNQISSDLTGDATVIK